MLWSGYISFRVSYTVIRHKFSRACDVFLFSRSGKRMNIVYLYDVHSYVIIYPSMEIFISNEHSSAIFGNSLARPVFPGSRGKHCRLNARM